VVGVLVFSDLQARAEIYNDIPVSARRLTTANLPRLAARAPTAHKGRFGHLLLIGGDHGFGGAIVLSTESALCAAVRAWFRWPRAREHVPAALARIPEVMVLGPRRLIS
jgi:NAD(P)H-hydrate repair Nnr-like enzyme with NAD(P)H-hydrate dehydratase domain